MFEMIGDFSFNLEKDCYERKDGEKLLIKVKGPNYWTVIVKNSKGVFPRDIFANDFEDLKNKILTIIKYDNPPTITKESIENLTNKSNKAEVLFLENRVSNLEERVAILEDSVEDLEEWRHK